MSDPYYGNRVRRTYPNPIDPADEYGWYESSVFTGAGADGSDKIGAGEDDPWWTDVVTSSVSIIDKIIGAATGQTGPKPSGSPSVDPFAGSPPAKKGIPTWVWVAGAAGAAFLLLRRRK